jgi:CubicO group peptidase (beta-lactamase class C family)
MVACSQESVICEMLSKSKLPIKRMKSSIGIWRYVRWIGVPASILLALLAFLWFRSGWDIRYMMRVLVHRESSTSDFQWKDSMPVAPAAVVVPWLEAPNCSAVESAFATQPGISGMNRYLSQGGAVALVVVHNGALVCEWYGNGGARDRLAAAFSMSKTVISLVLARAVLAGKIASLDDPITVQLPALVARDRRFDGIKLADLVDMRSGIAFQHVTSFPWVDQDSPAVYYASDLAETTLARSRIEAVPGRFLYNDYAPNLIGLALQRAYRAPLATGPMQALWTQLGSEYPAAWSIDSHGFAWHESGLIVTARDFARVGQLMLDNGKVGDRQVAPSAFITRSLDPVGRKTVVTFDGTELGYRNGWWVLGDDLIAMGAHGQIMLVSLATKTVIVRMGHDGHDETNISIARRLQRVANSLAASP